VRFFIFTDIPVWVRPLAQALEARGAGVHVGDDPEVIHPGDFIVNRISTHVARRHPEKAETMRAALARWEAESRLVINGADCLQLGFSKWLQAQLLERCGVATARTERAQPGARRIPDQPVLLKPPAGGFGRGIRRLEVGEPVPDPLEGAEVDTWIEQEILEPADGAVHRVETLGGDVLYEAVSPIQPDCFDYCLAHASPEVVLKQGSELPPTITADVSRILNFARMDLGSVEYLLDQEGQARFIDINPVSSIHPEAQNVLGRDPMEVIADYLCRQAASVRCL
jgi:hypothetical protein